jgi:hypothetical protein
MIPISVMHIAWWLAACLPIFMCLAAAAFIGVNLFDSSADASFLQVAAALLLWLVLGVYAVAFTVLSAPWFFRWYFIAVGLMFGRRAMADQKEAELMAAINRAEQVS